MTRQGWAWAVFGALLLFLSEAAGSAERSGPVPFKVVHAFTTETGQPSQPVDGLLQTADGSLWGSTARGGVALSGTESAGTVFRIRPQGTLKVVFRGQKGDGIWAGGLPAIGQDGSAYLTARGDDWRCGMAYKVGRDGKADVLHRFSQGLDGCNPTVPTLGSDGALYGSTNTWSDSFSMGALYKILGDGTFVLLHEFTDDGRNPNPLMQAGDGNFYGTTWGYGSHYGGGSAFRMAPDGEFTTLAAFNSVIGTHPLGRLTQASDGNFYGVTAGGTGFDGPPGIFRMTPDGQLSKLADLRALGGPRGALVQARDGYLYGLAGVSPSVAYRMSLGGELAVVHTFVPETDGLADGTLLQGRDGYLYGTAAGGPLGGGTVFGLWPDGGAAGH